MAEPLTLPIEICSDDALNNKGVTIIDCRSTQEYELGHVDEAINLPLQHLSVQIDEFPCNCDDSIFVYCRTGNRSSTFAIYLRSIGFTKCQSIAGGYAQWGDETC